MRELERISETLSQQVAEALKFACKAVEGINVEDHTSRIVVSSAQEAVLNSYCDVLEAQKNELEQEMQSVILDYSAKIVATSQLIRQVARMLGRHETQRELYEEQRGAADEKTSTDAIGRSDQKPPE